MKFKIRKIARSLAISRVQPDTIASRIEGYAEALSIFDENFYINNNPDVASSGQNAFKHYIEYGWKEGRDPSGNFSTRHYLAVNRDVAESGKCPLLHYAKYGMAEGRSTKSEKTIGDQVFPMQGAQAGAVEIDQQSVADQHFNTQPSNLVNIPPYIEKDLRSEFNEKFYRAHFDNLPDSVDALQHYLNLGWKTGINPNGNFDAQDYLSFNPDVAAASVHPFIHYVAAGRNEGRACKHLVKNEKNTILGASSTAERASVWARPSNLFGLIKDVFIHRLERVIPPSTGGLVVSLSHDNYLNSVGGVQIYLSDEQGAFNKKGWCYLHISPAVPLPGFSENIASKDFLFNVNFNGVFIGTVSAAVLAIALIEIKVKYPLGSRVIIHSLLGCNPVVGLELCRDFKPDQIFMFFHDFSALCPNFTLLRNDVSFCRAPPIESDSCNVCVYGNERRRALRDFDRFFRETKVELVFPSEAAKTFWEKQNSYSCSGGGRVFEHASLIDLDNQSSKISSLNDVAFNENEIKIAFIGTPSYYKGWNQFRDLATNLIEFPEFKFFALCKDIPQSKNGINHIPVAVDSANRQSMIEAIRENSIDIVVMWSFCHETFSFTTLEAIASGAYIIARKDSGNVDALIRQYDAGVLLVDFHEIGELIRDTSFLQNVFQHRRRNRQRKNIVPTEHFATYVME